MLRQLCLVFAVGCVLGAAMPSCGGDSGSSAANACLACGQTKCPSQSSACDASSGCKMLRSCELSCQTGDNACTNACVSQVASDSNAVVAGANLLECATSMCPTECNPGSSGSAGSTGHGGTTGNAGSTGHGGSTGTGTGGTGVDLYCSYALEWAVGCGFDSDPPFRTCDASVIKQCQAQCYPGENCTQYAQAKSGMINDLAGCVAACSVGNTANPTPSCLNTAGKYVVCDLGGGLPCDDTKPVDQCYNRCFQQYDCDTISDNLSSLKSNAFGDCINNCESTGGGGTGGTFTVAAGGYVTSGTWAGFAWTATDGKSSTTISPADFSTVAAGGSLCASGTVAGTADYSAVALLGVNLNQPTGDPAPAPRTWTPTGAGVVYSVTNTGGSPLRIQIQAAGGDSDATKRWCAPITAGSGVISWSTFNTACWDGTGTNYNGTTPLQSIMALVPGDLVAVPFNFCLNSVAPR